MNTPDTDVKDFEAEGLIETNPTTPDTEWKLPKADMLADDIYGHQKEWYERTKVEAILTAHTAYWKNHEHDMYESLEKEYQLQVKHAQEERDTYWKERVEEIIKMADALELECGKDGDKGTKQWMAFKGFRNTIRDRFLTNEDNLK